MSDFDACGISFTHGLLVTGMAVEDGREEQAGGGCRTQVSVYIINTKLWMRVTMACYA